MAVPMVNVYLRALGFVLGRAQLKRDGTRCRTGREVKMKLANGVPFTLPWNFVYPALLPLMRTPRLPVVD